MLEGTSVYQHLDKMKKILKEFLGESTLYKRVISDREVRFSHLSL